MINLFWCILMVLFTLLNNGKGYSILAICTGIIAIVEFRAYLKEVKE